MWSTLISLGLQGRVRKLLKLAMQEHVFFKGVKIDYFVITTKKFKLPKLWF